MDVKRAAQGATTTLGVVAAAAAARRAWHSPPAYLARMSGTSISAPDAVAWVTDFLNAAYYARLPELRDVRGHAARLRRSSRRAGISSAPTAACTRPTCSPSTARSFASGSSTARTRRAARWTASSC